VKEDLIRCRQQWRHAIVKVWDNRVWTVQAGQDDRMPMWSRYTIHQVT
jgi:hypothetical protein